MKITKTIEKLDLIRGEVISSTSRIDFILGYKLRTYFSLKPIQFNVISADTLKAAQKEPEKYRNLIVRVAGYSDYFNNLSKTLQDEIISRTQVLLKVENRVGS